jgi:hypothetical protein
MSGFLIGFMSPSEPDEAYIHFVGVSPGARASGRCTSASSTSPAATTATS